MHPRRRVFVVDDHPFIRESLGAFIARADGLELCGVAASGHEALRKILHEDCDLVLVDISMPGMNGLELVRLLREQNAELSCLMLTGHAEEVYVRDSLEAGARGFVTKGDPSVLLMAIRKVLDGDVYLNDARIPAPESGGLEAPPTEHL